MGTNPDYLRAAMRYAQYEKMEEGAWYAQIPGIPGLWASGANIEDTRNDLLSALDDWLRVNATGARIPPPEFDGISPLGPPRTAEG